MEESGGDTSLEGEGRMEAEEIALAEAISARELKKKNMGVVLS